MFENKDSVEAAAIVRNGMVLSIEGEYKIISFVDYYKRDNEGNPIPAKKRDLGNFGAKLFGDLNV